jgi:hypothetical protein
MRSSLTFQMLLHLGSYLIAGFAIFELAIILYKLIGETVSLSCLW